MYLTTNESGAWRTALLSPHGPANAYESEYAALALDASTNTLYAAWIYRKSATADALGVWTRGAAGPWSGPTDLVTVETVNGQPSLVGQVSVAAGQGRAYVAFAAAPSAIPGPCPDTASRSADAVVAAYDGHTWSRPRNLTSCVSDLRAQAFADPKLALDEHGRAYLISLDSTASGNLWFIESDGGAWSTPSRITHESSIGLYAGSPALRGLYALAASGGAVYVAYARPAGAPGADVLLLTRPAAGTWSVPAHVSPPDAQGCPKWGLAIAARTGRVAVAYIRSFGGYCHVVDVANATNRPNVRRRAARPARARRADPACGQQLRRHRAGERRRPLPGRADLWLRRAGAERRPVLHAGVPGCRRAHGAPERRGDDGGDHADVERPGSTPGSGVAAYTLQVRKDGGAWQTLLPATRATRFVYSPVQAGHDYSFRLRARDGANNWGAWVLAQTTVS